MTALTRTAPPLPMRPATSPERFSAALFSHSVRPGFPSPADDYTAEALDLNEYLIAHKEATFFLRAKGLSMTGAGIQDGDLLVVDRSLNPAHRCVVIAVVDGEFTVKRLYKRGARSASKLNFPRPVSCQPSKTDRLPGYHALEQIGTVFLNAHRQNHRHRMNQLLPASA